MQLLRETTALCRRCNLSHPAKVVIDQGRVLGITHCPEGDDIVEISSKPSLYRYLTEQSNVDLSAPPPDKLNPVLNYLSITNACNFHCRVCGTDAGGADKCTYLSLEEICQRALRARAAGAKILHLFGGEPSMHPDILEVIRRMVDMGLSVGLVSNGYTLSQGPGFAKELKAAGLERVCLQFDSLRESSLSLLARRFLDEKQQAIQHVIGAGLALGLNCTATQQTLSEMGELLEHGLNLGPAVRNMTFGCAAPVGRFNISEDNTVDRESIVAALIEEGAQSVFTLEDIVPLPVCLPWGIEVHPDCGVHIILFRSPNGLVPLNRLIDLRKWYRRLAAIKGKGGRFSAIVRPAWALLCSSRPGKRIELLRSLLGMARSRAGYGFVNIAVTDYRAAAFLDEQRLCRCASSFHTSVGPVKACLHFYQNPKIPGTQVHESLHGSC